MSYIIFFFVSLFPLFSHCKKDDNLTVYCSVKAILDANRNALMLLDLKFSIGTLGLGAGTFIAALYGMNLTNFMEESSIGLGAVSLACSALTLSVCVYAMKRLRRVQRIKMWGETGSHHHYLSSSSSHHHQPYTSLTPTSRALETPVTAALVGKDGGVAAAIAEKKAERVKNVKKAAAAAAVAAAAKTPQGSTEDITTSARADQSIRHPAFGPRYGDPQSRLGNKKSLSPSDADASDSSLGRQR